MEGPLIQLLFVVALVVLSLIDYVARRVQRRPPGVPDEKGKEPDEIPWARAERPQPEPSYPKPTSGRPEPSYPRPEPTYRQPEPSAPPQPSYRQPGPSSRRSEPAYRRREQRRREPSPPVPTGPRAPVAPAPPAPPRRQPWIRPRAAPALGRREARQGIVLMTILGPPRGLQPLAAGDPAVTPAAAPGRRVWRSSRERAAPEA